MLKYAPRSRCSRCSIAPTVGRAEMSRDASGPDGRVRLVAIVTNSRRSHGRIVESHRHRRVRVRRIHRARSRSCCAACSSGWVSRGRPAPQQERHAAKQGDINFIINAEPDSFGQRFAQAHGPSACAMAFRVKDAAAAFERAVELGAKPRRSSVGPDGAQHPGHRRHRRRADLSRRSLRRRTIYDVDFMPVAAAAAGARRPRCTSTT